MPSLRTLIIILNVAALVFLAGVALAAVRERRRRRPRAPNLETFYDDDVLETGRLTRVLGWALSLVAVTAVSLPVYWLIEPARQDARDERFLEDDIEQGGILFAANDPEVNPLGLGCEGCHGPGGEGGAAPTTVTVDRAELVVAAGALNDPERACAPSADDPEKLICQVAWDAPSLNDVFSRFSRDEIVRIVTFGRPGTPMPAWGIAGGGPKNEQSIDNIVDFLQSIQLPPQEALAKQAGVTDGRELFEASCARCHTKHWSYRNTFAGRDDVALRIVAGGGAFGPNLTGGVTIRQFPNIDDQVAFVLSGSGAEQSYGVRGIGSGRMPGFDGLLAPEQVRAIVEYERGLEAPETE